MAYETEETFCILLENGNVVQRCVRVRERMVTTYDSAQVPLEEFRKRHPNVKIRNYSEDVEINLAKVPVVRLPEVLADVKDPDLIKKWQSEDERSTALQHYIKRLEELGDDSGDDGSAG